MSKVFSAHAVSVDGYISGRTPDGDEEFGRGLGDAPVLFDWYFDGDTPSHVFDGFKLSEPSARFFVLSHRPVPEIRRGRLSSPPGSRTRSRRRVRPPATRTSPSWAAAC